MCRRLQDYIDRFYTKEGKRSTALAADNFALAHEIADWKAKVAQAWDGIKVLNIEDSEGSSTITSTGSVHHALVTLDT